MNIVMITIFFRGQKISILFF